MILAGQVYVQSTLFKPGRHVPTSEEIEAEEQWANAFANSQDALRKLAEKARADYLAGRTEILNPDEL